VTSPTTTAPSVTAPSIHPSNAPLPAHDETPPERIACLLGALVAEPSLREPLLGDMAEEFAERCARDGAAPARRWYRAQALRSAPHLVAACWWPHVVARRRRLGRLVVGTAGGYLTLLLLHQGVQLLAGLVLTNAGDGGASWTLAACSLAAGAAGAVLGGRVAARALPEAPLAAALTLAVLCAALAVAGMLTNGGVTPLWYWGGLQLLVLPLGACAGGLRRALRQARDADDRHPPPTRAPR
jgi:hypothetical protein